jgi:hypothetical protein
VLDWSSFPVWIEGLVFTSLWSGAIALVDTQIDYLIFALADAEIRWEMSSGFDTLVSSFTCLKTTRPVSKVHFPA